MDAVEITSAQIAREITNQRKFVVRFQHQMPAPAYLHEEMDAEYIGVTLINNQLVESFGPAGKALSPEEINAFLAMIPKNESDYWASYARRYNINENQTNTDPQIVCWPAQSITSGDNPSKQAAAFYARFF
jgi:hypothetical protein